MNSWSESVDGGSAFAEAEILISHLPESSKAIGLVGQELRDLANHGLADFAAGIGGQWLSLHERQEEFGNQQKFSAAAAMQVEKKKLLAQFLRFVTVSRSLIPTYSFPVHSCRLEVIQNKGTTSFIGAPQNDGLQLDRDATLAISEYAPGAEVVAGGRIWVSAGIVRYPKDFMPLQHYLVCRICRHVQISMNHDDIEPLCPQCHSMNHERRSFIEPKGFLTAYQDAEGRDPASSRIRQRPVEEARLITRVATDRYQMTDVATSQVSLRQPPLSTETLPRKGGYSSSTRAQRAEYLRCPKCEHAESAPLQALYGQPVHREHSDPRSGERCRSRRSSFPI